MSIPDNVLNICRFLVLLLSLWCCYKLLWRFRKFGDNYTGKTKDYWYALLMWAVVGVVTMAQGIYLNRPLTPATIIIAAAVLVTGKGLHSKGSWGGDE